MGVPGCLGNVDSSYLQKTPLKNVKKKLDCKNNVKAYINIVMEALSDAINKTHLRFFPFI
ncbi:pentatricopeptide repeat-containing protein [Pyrus ussuriensis x Pyrus communis]|uniref:Pentatricopeptide repeat-containing protein n=1 Tax=Pyrus ussuriensis x Pyrus communis TaxID=2448454 RepID=A0A5N5IAR2_9ROSA|nr:pentatricopeptide repeat-containing protein [Pyrus ussuriensis x Pyrus communis]